MKPVKVFPILIVFFAIFSDIVYCNGITYFENIKKYVKTCGKPRINNVMHNLTLNPGESARFKCSVDMKCLVSYIQWFHEMNNGTMRLLRTASDTGDPYSFRIHRVDGLDEGFYTCVAGNILGETLSSAYLEINGGRRERGATSLLLFVVLMHLLVGLYRRGDRTDL